LLPLLGGSNSHSTLNLPERDLFKPYLSFHSLRVSPGSYFVQVEANDVANRRES